MGGILSKERSIAKADFNRWLVPPAALAIHLSIGMAYGFSVFWLPLSRDASFNAIPWGSAVVRPQTPQGQPDGRTGREPTKNSS